jgi:arsenite/tail-anchored protein-transporting ATPase
MKDPIQKNLKFILFGGKGGVGKTTMAGTCALHLAKKYPQKKILIFTSDPAPSLGHMFEQKLNNEPQPIKGLNNLLALEINAEEELKKFKKEYGNEILDIMQKGTYFSDEETEEMFSLNIPGLDEIMSLKRIMDFMKSNNYDLFILDTAPTGHTLRLLCLPELLDKWIKFLANLRWKYRYMVKRFAKTEQLEKADEFLLEMKKTVKNVHSMLRDKKKTTFVVVTIAEAMGVMETQNLVKDLKNYSIPCQEVIINNLVPKSENTFLSKRRKLQQQYVKEIKTSFKGFNITQMELDSGEIKGIIKLEEISTNLFR